MDVLSDAETPNENEDRFYEYEVYGKREEFLSELRREQNKHDLNISRINFETHQYPNLQVRRVYEVTSKLK